MKEDINKHMSEGYKYLHEKQGIGFNEPTPSDCKYGMTFRYVKENGSIWEDVIPVLVDDRTLLTRLAPYLNNIVISHFEENNKDDEFTYTTDVGMFYKH
jgi:hypothetical protein